MKKLLLLLLTCLLTTAAWADTWTSGPKDGKEWKKILSDYSQSSAPATWTATSGNLTLKWDMSYSWADSSKQYFTAGTTGLTFGSSKNGLTGLTLTCDPGQNTVISKVTIKGLKTGDGSGTASVKIGNSAFGNPVSITNTNTDAVFNGSASGKIEISISGVNVGKQIIFTGLEVEYTKSTGPTKPVKPTITPEFSTYAPGQQFTIDCATTDATLTMTYGEEMVDEQSFPYTFTLNNEGTYAVEAIAYLNGESSESLTGNIIIAIPKPGAPVFEPASNAEGIEVAGGTQVKVSYPQGAVLNISLKKDDADVALDVNGANPFVYTLEDEAIYEFSATATHNGKTSDIVNASYIVTFPTLDAPVITPASGTITLGEAVTFTCAEGASMDITVLDGNANDCSPAAGQASGYQWIAPKADTFTISAIAKQKYHTDSDAADATITVALPKAATPVFSPAGGDIYKGNKVTITCATEGATLTLLDGEANTIAENVPFPYEWTATALGSYSFYATAAADGLNESDTADASYQVVEAPKTVSATVDMTKQGWNDGTLYKSDNRYTVDWKSDEKDAENNPRYIFSTTATVSGNSTYPAYNSNKNPKGLRLYSTSNNKVTINAPEGYKFVSAKATSTGKLKYNGATTGTATGTTVELDGATSFYIMSGESSTMAISRFDFVLEPLVVAPEAPTFNPVSGSEVRKDDIITISCNTEGAKLNLYDAELNPIVTDASFPYSYTVSMESGTLELMAEAVGSTGLKTDAVATYTVTNDSRVFIDLQQQGWKDPSDNNNTKSPYNKDNGFAADYLVTSTTGNDTFTKFATIAKVTLPKTGNYPTYYEETKGDATTGALRMYPANGNWITIMAPAGYAFTRANVVYTKADVIKINGQGAASGAYVNFTDQPTFINFDVTGVTIDETGNNKSVRLTGINLGLVWVGKLGKPNFNPPTEGPWDAGTVVSIACGDPNADIEYTVTEPGGTPTTYTNKQAMAKFILNKVGTWTVTAQAKGYEVDADHRFEDSESHTKTYQVVACQAPEFSPANGSEVGYGSKITMKTSSTGCKIWRKVEGVDTDWVQAASYTVKATEAGTLKIQAKAVNEYGESTISEATYTVVARPIVAPKLTFTVAEGNFKPDAAFDVEIKLNDDCFPVPETIYYTLNGTRAHVAPAHEEAFEHRSVYTLGTKIPVSAEQAKALTGGAHSQALTINAYCDNGLEPDDPNYASDTASATYTFAPTTYTQGTEVTYDQWTRITKDSTLGDGLGLLMVSTEHSQAMSTTQKKSTRWATPVTLSEDKTHLLTDITDDKLIANGIQYMVLKGNAQDGWYFYIPEWIDKDGNTQTKGYLYTKGTGGKDILTVPVAEYEANPNEYPIHAALKFMTEDYPNQGKILCHFYVDDPTKGNTYLQYNNVSTQKLFGCYEGDYAQMQGLNSYDYLSFYVKGHGTPGVGVTEPAEELFLVYNNNDYFMHREEVAVPFTYNKESQEYTLDLSTITDPCNDNVHGSSGYFYIRDGKANKAGSFFGPDTTEHPTVYNGAAAAPALFAEASGDNPDMALPDAVDYVYLLDELN